jgi:hypothetical protein
MRYRLTALSFALLAGHAMAQGYSAKSLFFGDNDAVVAVSTAQKAPGDSALNVATGQNSAPAPAAATADTRRNTQSAPAVGAAPRDSGKAIVQVVNRKPNGPKTLGASYFIRLKTSDGSTHDVLATRTFHSGERFQLGVKVNRPAYVYILNEAPDGTVTQIYPQSSQDNFINAMGVVFFPGKGSFQFDDKPGAEQLLVFLSPEPASGDMAQRIRSFTPDLISAPGNALHTADEGTCPATSGTATTAQDSSGVMQVASANSDYAAKGISFADDAPTACAGKGPQASDAGYAAKGIVFSDDAQPEAGGQVASYVVKKTTTTEANLYLKIKLVHE